MSPLCSPSVSTSASRRSSIHQRLTAASFRSTSAASTSAGASRPEHDEDVDARQHALGDERRVLGADPAVGRQQDLLDLGHDVGAVAVARDVDEARDEAPGRVTSSEQPDLLALLQVQDARRDLEAARRC